MYSKPILKNGVRVKNLDREKQGFLFIYKKNMDFVWLKSSFDRYWEHLEIKYRIVVYSSRWQLNFTFDNKKELKKIYWQVVELYNNLSDNNSFEVGFKYPIKLDFYEFCQFKFQMEKAIESFGKHLDKCYTSWFAFINAKNFLEDYIEFLEDKYPIRKNKINAIQKVIDRLGV